MSIINYFSFVIPSLTRHLYKEYELVQTIISIANSPSYSITFVIIELITYTKSALATIPYISNASTLLVTLLLFVLLQQIRLLYRLNSLFLVFLFSFTSIIIKPIQELKSLLFINKPLINTYIFALFRSKITYLRLRSRFFVYYSRRLFKARYSSIIGS